MRLWRGIFPLLSIASILAYSIFYTPFAVAASSPWSQTDWSGGSGQTAFTTNNKYSSGSNIVTSSANQVTLATNASTGNGNDGAITISANKNINTDNMISGRSCSDGGDAVNYSVTSSLSSGASSITLSSTPASGCLASGDEILIINLQGTSTDNSNVGKYETAIIQSISTATLTLNSTLSNAYDGTTQKIMVQRVPNYTNVTVNGSTTLTASAWNGIKGGVLFFRASGIVTVTGTISANSLGYRGGTGASPSGSNVSAQQGEGYVLGQSDSGSANSGGGGGGNSNRSGSNDTSGGGGGGYGTTGSTGANKGGGGTNPNGGGTGGGIYGSATLATIFLGGGGGAGGGSDSGCTLAPGGNGGAGGGIIFVVGATVSVAGGITATGSNGSQPGTSNCTGGGGGGAGGSINMLATSLTVGSNLVTATAGSGGGGRGFAGGGGTGGDGIIALYSPSSISGTTNPANGTSVTAYVTSGTLTSSIFDIGFSSVNWGTLTYNATTPTNTSVSVKVRTGSQSDLSDAVSFSSCTAVSSGASIATNSCVSSSNEFVQYQITFSTSDTSSSPTFTSFSLTFAQQSNAPGKSPPSTGNAHAPCQGSSISGIPNLYELTPSVNAITVYFTPVTGVSGYTISYGTSSSANQYATSFNNNDTSGAVSYTINSLQSNTAYYFKVYGINGCSTTATSNVLSSNTQKQSTTTVIPIVNNVVQTFVPQKRLDIVSSKLTTTTPTPRQQHPSVSSGVSLAVKVLGTNNKPLAGVNVTLHSKIQKTKTDSNGIAHFTNVEKGSHEVLLAYNGYQGQQSLKVDGSKKDQTLTVQVQLQNGVPWSWFLFAIGGAGIIIILLLFIIVRKIIFSSKKKGVFAIPAVALRTEK